MRTCICTHLVHERFFCVNFWGKFGRQEENKRPKRKKAMKRTPKTRNQNVGRTENNSYLRFGTLMPAAFGSG